MPFLCFILATSDMAVSPFPRAEASEPRVAAVSRMPGFSLCPHRIDPDPSSHCRWGGQSASRLRHSDRPVCSEHTPQFPPPSVRPRSPSAQVSCTHTLSSGRTASPPGALPNAPGRNERSPPVASLTAGCWALWLALALSSVPLYTASCLHVSSSEAMGLCGAESVLHSSPWLPRPHV